MANAHTESLSKTHILDTTLKPLLHRPGSLQGDSNGERETFGTFPSHNFDRVRSGSDMVSSDISLRMTNSKEVPLVNGISLPRRIIKLSEERDFSIGSSIQKTTSSELQSPRSKKRRPPSPSVLRGTSNKRQRTDSVVYTQREARRSSIVDNTIDRRYEHPHYQAQKGYLQKGLGSSRSYACRSSPYGLDTGSHSWGHQGSPKKFDSSKENPDKLFKVVRGNFQHLQSTRALRNIRGTSNFGKIGTKSIDLQDDLDKFNSENNSSTLYRSPTWQRSKRAASLVPVGLATSRTMLQSPPNWATKPKRAKKIQPLSLVHGSQPRKTSKDSSTFEIYNYDVNNNNNEVYHTNNFLREQRVTIPPRQHNTQRENLNRDSKISKQTSKQLIVDQQQSTNQWIDNISLRVSNVPRQIGRSESSDPHSQRGRQTSVPLLIPRPQEKPEGKPKALRQAHEETNIENKDGNTHALDRVTEAISESSDSVSFETLMRISRKALKDKKQLSPSLDYHIRDILPKTNIFEGQERKKQAAEVEKREREKRRDTTVEAEPEEIKRRKIKQDELKKQVASLQISKPKRPLNPVLSSPFISTVYVGANGKSSLFLPDAPAIHNRYDAVSDKGFPSGLDPSLKDNYDIDDRIARAKSMDPTTAAGHSATIQVKQNSSNYQNKREAFKPQVASEKAEKALAKTTSTLKANPYTKPIQVENSPVTTAIFAPQLDFKYSHLCCGPGPDDGGTTALIKPSQVVPLTSWDLEASAEKRTLQVLSEAGTRTYEQQKYKEELQETERIREEKACIQTEKHEENKKKAREKYERLALEEKKQKLLNQAAARGTEMTEMDLALQLEDFKQKRAERNKKSIESRAKNKERKDKESMDKNFGSSVLRNSEEEEEKRQRSLIKERRKAEATASFIRASGMSVANESDSDESEEDPLEEIIGEKTILILDDESEQIRDNEDIDIETEDDAEDTETGTRPSNNKTERARLLDRPIELEHYSAPVIHDCNTCVYVYQVMQCVTKRNIQELPLIKQMFLDLKEATSFAQELAERYRRQEAASSFLEKPYKTLYAADIYMGNDSVMVYMEKVLKAKDSTELTKFDTSNILKTPRHCYFVMSIIEKRYKDGDDEIINVRATDVHDNFTDMDLAGVDACKKLIKFIEPKEPTLENIEKYENELLPEIRKQRDIAVDEKRAFDLTVDDELPDWMVQQGYKSVNFIVEDRPLQGLMN